MKSKTTCASLFVLVMLCVGCASDAPTVNTGDAEVELDADEQHDEPYEPVLDVTSLFSIDVLADPTGINLQVKKDVVKEIHEGDVWLVPFAFRSQIWHGNPWDHPSVLYVPATLNPDYAGTIAIIQQGTDDFDAGVNVGEEFGALTAIELGIPVTVLAKVPHPTLFNEVESASLAASYPFCFGSLLVEDFLQTCGDRLTRTSEKFKWSVDLAMARAYMRAITALEGIPALLDELEDSDIPAFTVENAVIGGAGKRGRAIWLSAAVDDRVSGMWIAAHDMSNLDAFYENMAEVWGGAYPLVSPGDEQEYLGDGFGLEWRAMADPYGYMGELDGIPIMLVRGSNDGFYPLGSYLGYQDRLPTEHGYLIVDNYGHGMASEKHVMSWRGLVHQAAGGANTMLVGIELEADQVDQSVTISSNIPVSQAGISSVWLYYTATQMVDDMDLRDAVWLGVDLMEDDVSPAGATYEGTFISAMSHWGAYIEVRYTDMTGAAQIVTSPPLLSWD